MGVDGALLDAPPDVCSLFSGVSEREKTVVNGSLYPPAEGCVVNHVSGTVNALLISDDGEQVCGSEACRFQTRLSMVVPSQRTN